MVDGSMPSARAAWPASRLGDLVESHSSIWSPSTRAVQDTGSMQACDRNGIENSASSTFAADFIPAATSPWLPIVGVPGCSSPCLNAASTVAEEALSFGWLAYVSRTSANALTACQYWWATTATPFGLGIINRSDGRPIGGAVSYGRVQHVRSFEIKSEAGAPVDLWRNIQPVQRLTDQEKLLSSAQPRLCRNRLPGRGRRQLSERQIAAGLRVCHFGFRYEQVAGVDPHFLGCCGDEHLPRGRCRSAHRVVEAWDRRTAGRQDEPFVEHWIDVFRPSFASEPVSHPRPSGSQLGSDDLGHPGRVPLTTLGLRNDCCDNVILADSKEGVELPGAPWRSSRACWADR